MNKGIRFNKISTPKQHFKGQWPIIPCWFISCMFFIIVHGEKQKTQNFNPIQDGLSWGCSRIGGGGAERRPTSLKFITHILQWSNLAQLYLTQSRSKKYMNHVTHFLISAEISIFSSEISKFCYNKKYRYRLYFDI